MPRRRLLLAGLLLAAVALTWSGREGEAKTLPAGLSEATWALDGRPMYAVHAGDVGAPPVLFVHGSPGGWDAYERYLVDPELRARAHLISVDRPGFGRSGRGEAEPSLEVQAACALSALSLNRSGEPAVLVGHSLGGPVVARAAMDAPEAVRGLLLLAASIDPALEELRWYNRLADLRAVRWLLPAGARTSNDEIVPLRAELDAMMPGWSELGAPVVVIHGDKDRLVPVENADFAGRMVPHAEVRRMPGEDHFIPWTQEAEVKSALLDLLKR